MRYTPVLLLLSLASFANAQNPAAGGRHSLSMDVTVTSSGGASRASMSKTDNHIATGLANAAGADRASSTNYSSSRDRKSSIGLTIEVRNLSSTADTAKVEWYFVGSPVGKSDDFIFDQGSKDVAVGPASSVKVPIESAELATHEEKHLRISNAVHDGTNIPVGPQASSKKSGSKPSGWVVRLLADGRVIGVRASNPTLENIAKNDATLKTLPHRSQK